MIVLTIWSNQMSTWKLARSWWGCLVWPTASRNCPRCTRRVCSQGCCRSWARVELDNPRTQRVANLLPSFVNVWKKVIISWWFSPKIIINNLTFWLTVTEYCSFRRRPPICWSWARNRLRPAQGLGFWSLVAAARRWSGPGRGPPPAPRGGSWSQTSGWCWGVVRPMLRKKRKDRIS